MDNPFQLGHELGADEPVDCEEEITEVPAAIRQGGTQISGRTKSRTRQTCVGPKRVRSPRPLEQL